MVVFVLALQHSSQPSIGEDCRVVARHEVWSVLDYYICMCCTTYAINCMHNMCGAHVHSKPNKTRCTDMMHVQV
jgi:hypothetical protein